MATISGGVTCLSETKCLITGVCCVNHVNGSDLTITTQKSAIKVKESETKPCNIWTSKPSQHFTCAAIYDASTHQYAACINNKLVIWDDSVPDITKVKPVATAETIQRLYPHTTDGGSVILYSSGAVRTTKMEQLFDAVTEDREGLLKPGEVIVDSHLWSTEEEGAYVVCLVEKSKQHSLCFIRVPEMNHSAEQVIQVSIDIPNKCSLLHTSFHSTNNQMILHAVGSNGDLYQSNISLAELAQCKILSCHAVIKKLSSNRHAKLIKIASMGSSLVAVVGLDGEFTDHVCVWDTKFSLLLAKQSLQTVTDRTRISVSNIIYACNHLWVSTNHGIHAFSVERAPSTLSVVLGRQGASDEINKLPVVGQQWRFDEQGDFEGDIETSEVNQSGEQGLLEDILNKDKVKTAKQFKSAVHKLLTNKHLTIHDVDKVTMLHRIVKHVCQRCTADKKFWPKEGLMEIIKTGLIAASSCADLVSHVIERGDIDVLVSCLQHMQDIPDSILASIIDFVLRDLSSDTEDSGRSDPPTSCPITEDTVQLIDLILNCPMNDIFMLECIAKVKFQQIMVLLRYLYYRLNTTVADDDQYLPANVVIDWIMLILDAHYSQLVLSPEARVLLINLNQIVETLSHYHDEVDEVHEMLRNLPSPITETPKAKPDAMYSIEVLKL